MLWSNLSKEGYSSRLFIIPSSVYYLCENLTSLIKNAESSGNIHGIKICKDAPTMSHLLFADDSFLFFKAQQNEALQVKGIQDNYAKASGHCINLQKSEITFSKNSHKLHRQLSLLLLGW